MICLDTDVVSALLRPQAGPSALARRLGVLPATRQYAASVTLAELLYGARKAGRVTLVADIERLMLEEIQILPFDEASARAYAAIRVELEAAGTPLDHPDLQIAAICLAHDLTLVTGNVRRFERVPGLQVENWLE